MRILIIGSGNMGKRYKRILNYNNIETVDYDLTEKFGGVELHNIDFDKAIIATPTNDHFEYCKKLVSLDKDFLCEKPVSKNPEEIKTLIELAECDVRMVCNWIFTAPSMVPFMKDNCHIYYDYYNTGRDGLEWDIIQLIHLASDFKSLEVVTESPVFNAAINNIPITQTDIEKSYLSMLEMWIEEPSWRNNMRAT